jgi:hypothetical protein
MTYSRTPSTRAVLSLAGVEMPPNDFVASRFVLETIRLSPIADTFVPL